MLGDALRDQRQLETGRAGRRVRVAGLVVARQRPATANGITFMLLEDEFGAINLIVPPPVYEHLPGGGAGRAARVGDRHARAPRGRHEHPGRRHRPARAARPAARRGAPHRAEGALEQRAGGVGGDVDRTTCGRSCRRGTRSGGGGEALGYRRGAWARARCVSPPAPSFLGHDFRAGQVPPPRLTPSRTASQRDEPPLSHSLNDRVAGECEESGQNGRPRSGAGAGPVPKRKSQRTVS